MKNRVMTGSNYWTIRIGFQQWWYGSGKPLSFCGIYNDGHHLYIEDTLMPGTFITPPCRLKFFPHQAGIITVNNMWLAHRGHEYGATGGKATITAFNGSAQMNFEILPGHLAYVIHRDDVRQTRGFDFRIAFSPLPQRILG